MSKCGRKYLKDSYILFLNRTHTYIYIYNYLMVSLQFFANTDNPDDLQETVDIAPHKCKYIFLT